MGFARRLRLFLTGVGIGTILMYLFFKDRKFDSWLPEGRVLELIERNPVEIDENALCKMECLGWEADSVKMHILDGDVDFAASETQKKPCPAYQIDIPVEGKQYRFWIEACEKQSLILTVQSDIFDCNCD